jgi:hypothetical protein
MKIIKNNMRVLTVFLFSLLVSLNVMSQDIKVIEKKYYDKETKVLSKYTTCDSSQTIRVVSDNMISLLATTKLYENLKTTDRSIQVVNVIGPGVEHFIRKTAIDSNKNVLFININSNDDKSYAKRIIYRIYQDKDFLNDVKKDKPKTMYVNYFQVITFDNQCEHIVVTVIRENEENKYYYYYKEKY